MHGWVVDAVAEHLEAVARGEITRLCMNVPPGTMKSLMTEVFFPAWEWGPRGMASLRYLTATFELGNAERDCRRARMLIESDWYRQLWPHVRLTRSTQDAIENDQTGWREACAFGSLTGKRADRDIFDDPHSTKMAESEVQRRETLRIFHEDVPTRVNDPQRSAIIVMMQRIHVQDVAAAAIAQGYVHLMLPMEFEVDRRCATRWFVDPRTREGELLFPERFPREVVERDKATMTAHAVSGQFQQRPTPREGNLFKRAWFDGRIVGAAPADCVWWRHWDLAGSLRDPKKRSTQAWTAGVKMGWSPSQDRFFVGHVVRCQEEGAGVRAVIRAQAQVDGTPVKISLPQDPGQAGKVQKQDMVAHLAGFTVVAIPESGDKYARAEPFSAQCEAGNVSIVQGEWNQAWIDELSLFPSSAVKDQVDASSGSFARLVAEKATHVPFISPIVVTTPNPLFAVVSGSL